MRMSPGIVSAISSSREERPSSCSIPACWVRLGPMCRRTKGAAPRGRSRAAGERTAGELENDGWGTDGWGSDGWGSDVRFEGSGRGSQGTWREMGVSKVPERRWETPTHGADCRLSSRPLPIQPDPGFYQGGGDGAPVSRPASWRAGERNSHRHSPHGAAHQERRPSGRHRPPQVRWRARRTSNSGMAPVSAYPQEARRRAGKGTPTSGRHSRAQRGGRDEPQTAGWSVLQRVLQQEWRCRCGTPRRSAVRGSPASGGRRSAEPQTAGGRRSLRPSRRQGNSALVGTASLAGLRPAMAGRRPPPGDAGKGASMVPAHSARVVMRGFAPSASGRLVAGGVVGAGFACLTRDHPGGGVVGAVRRSPASGGRCRPPPGDQRSAFPCLPA